VSTRPAHLEGFWRDNEAFLPESFAIVDGVAGSAAEQSTLVFQKRKAVQDPSPRCLSRSSLVSGHPYLRIKANMHPWTRLRPSLPGVRLWVCPVRAM